MIHIPAESKSLPPSSKEPSNALARTQTSTTRASSLGSIFDFEGLCYIDAYTEPVEPSASSLSTLGETRENYLARLRNAPVHLCRLRYFGNEDRWSMAFYTYSHERYEACVFSNGNDHGTPEEAFEVASVYLNDAWQ